MSSVVLPPGEWLVDVVRSGVVEGGHHGHAVVLGPDGSILASAGDPTAVIFPRSANKPMQAIGLLELGFDASTEQLALAAASHAGQPVHVAVARSTLAAVGMTEDDLQCPPDLPLDQEAAEALLSAGGTRARIFMNCSGKHAAMLAVCRHHGWPTADYLDPGHPLQQHIAGTVARLTRAEPVVTGVDGCGAPLFAFGLDTLARTFLYIASAPAGPEEIVAAAMRSHPELVGGSSRTSTRLMRGIPGLLAKDGAEGVWAAALPGVGAVAVKIDDGAMRAADRVVVAALRRLGIEADVLRELAEQPLLGGGVPVGQVQMHAGVLD